MKIGLYFGSFNPVHNGHLIIANYVGNYTDLDRVWFVVSPQNPFKEKGSLIHENRRKHMIDLSIEGEKKLRTSNIEFKLPIPSYTIDTLTYLSDKHSGDDFSIIMGSDSFQNIKNWKNSAVLMKNYCIIIYERPGFKIDPTILKSNQVLLDAPLLDISSTRIREMIRGKKSIRYLVPDIVKEEIESQQYYK
jgi:nicotinate-nucleotide adenylyltransferase